MSVEENKAIVLRHLEVFNEGKLELVDEMISPDWVYRGPAGEFRGPQGFRRMVTATRSALPDIHYEWDEMIAEGDTVAARFTMTATHTGPFMGIPPTGKKIRLTGAFFYSFKDGKEVEDIPFGDMLSLYQQLGVAPPV
jgi:steroid delta-isomerase-like uncharacterized protein